MWVHCPYFISLFYRDIYSHWRLSSCYSPPTSCKFISVHPKTCSLCTVRDLVLGWILHPAGCLYLDQEDWEELTVGWWAWHSTDWNLWLGMGSMAMIQMAWLQRKYSKISPCSHRFILNRNLIQSRSNPVVNYVPYYPIKGILKF